MGNTQYAVCHLQRGSGNDSGMSCHIERKDARGRSIYLSMPMRTGHILIGNWLNFQME